MLRTRSRRARRPVLYRQAFASSAAGWLRQLTHLEEPVPPDAFKCFVSWDSKQSCIAPWTHDAAGRFMSAPGPWWVDNNHAPPGGAGWFGFIGYLRVDGLDGSPINQAFDLRDAEIELRIKLEQLDLKGAQIYFWFQTFDPVQGLYCNFYLHAQPIAPPPGRWSKVILSLTADPSRYTCLGAAVGREDTYGCMDVVQALASVTTDFGFIAFPFDLPGTPAFPADPFAAPSGVLHLAAVEIRGKPSPLAA